MNIIFYIKNEINEQTYKDFVNSIHGATSLHFKIDSCGGYIAYADKIIEKALSMEVPITTEQVGNVMSAASKIFAIGSKRIVNNSKGENIMIHLPRITFENETVTSRGMQNISNLMAKMEDEFVDTYSKVIKLSKEKIKEMMELETYLSNQKAYDIGLATDIEDNFKFVANGEKSVLKLEMGEEEKEERLISRILNVLEKRNEAIKAEAELLELKEQSGSKDQIIADLKSKLQDALSLVDSLKGENASKEAEKVEIVAKFEESKVLLNEALEKIQAQREPLITEQVNKETEITGNGKPEYKPMNRVPYNPFN